MVSNSISKSLDLLDGSSSITVENYSWRPKRVRYFICVDIVDKFKITKYNICYLTLTHLNVIIGVPS